MGFAPYGDIGDDRAVFQCAGGSAPTIAGPNIADPIAQILSAGIMLDWLGERHSAPSAFEATKIIEKSTASVLTAGHLTSDIGDYTKTDEFGNLVVAQTKNIS